MVKYEQENLKKTMWLTCKPNILYTWNTGSMVTYWNSMVPLADR